jgi:iron complex outermembrane receptor protein
MKLISPRNPILLAIIASLSTGANAQPMLEEVIVTARKRAQSLQDVPVSVSVVSGDLIKEGVITHFSDVAAQTPNFNMAQFNIGEPQYFIRGVGSTLDSAGSDPAVATFVDEVYVGRSGGASTDLYDLERIEILRGPQGTLFGKNVVGGAISVYTRRPTEDFEGSLNVSLGNYDLSVLQGALSGPIADGVSGRLVGSWRKRDEGYVENVLDGEEYQDEENMSLRGQLLLRPTDRLQILVGADYSEDDQAGNCRNVNNLELNDPLGLAAVYPPIIAATTGGDVRKCASPVQGEQTRDIAGGQVRVEWELDSMTLTSISAYRDMDYDHLEDLAGMPTGVTPFNLADGVNESSEQFSQELRLSSNGDGRLSWLAGAFYMEEEIDRSERFTGEFGPPLVPGAAVLLNGDVAFTQNAETTSYAVFGQIGYQFNDAWSLTVGSRYNYDEKDIAQGLLNFEDPAFDTAVLAGTLGVPAAVIEGLFAPQQAVVLGVPVNSPTNLGAFAATGDVSVLNFPYSIDADDDWDEVTSSASINWAYNDDSMLYLSWSQGYKSGAFVSSTTTPEAAATPLDPEIATNYELGLKTEFWDNRLRLNASLFTMEYEDLQVFRLVGTRLVGANAEATSEGLELDVTALLTENWILQFNYAYLDAEYDTFEDGVNDFSGNTLPRAPEDSYFIRSSYVWNLPGASELEFIASYAYTGEFQFEASNQPAAEEDGYGLWDASLSWRDAGERWEVRAWGRNLDDEEYRIHTIVSNIAGTVDVWGAPRTYGLSVQYAW